MAVTADIIYEVGIWDHGETDPTETVTWGPTVTSHTFTQLPAGSRYEIRIRAINVDGEGPWSTTAIDTRTDLCSSGTTNSCSLRVGGTISGYINMGDPDTDWYAVELEAGEIYRIRVNGSTPQDPEPRMNDSASNAISGATDNDGGTVRVPETRPWSLTCRDWGSMLSPRVPNLVPIPGLRMERETPGQRPRPNYGHPQGRC